MLLFNLQGGQITGVHIFLKSIRLRMNGIAGQEFELAY